MEQQRQARGARVLERTRLCHTLYDMRICVTEKREAQAFDLRPAGELAPSLALPWIIRLRYGVILGQAIGRLGCFSAGCCWGKPTHLPWAVAFTGVYSARAVGTPMDTPLHPTQLYESFAAFLIFFFLLWLAPRKRFNGQVTLAYVALYSAVRFAIEFVRGDPDRGAWFHGAVSTSQLIAIVLLVGVALVSPRLRKAQALAPAASASAPRGRAGWLCVARR